MIKKYSSPLSENQFLKAAMHISNLAPYYRVLILQVNSKRSVYEIYLDREQSQI